MQETVGATWLPFVGAGVGALLMACLASAVLRPFERCAGCPHRHLWRRWRFWLLCACAGWSRPLGPTSLPDVTGRL